MVLSMQEMVFSWKSQQTQCPQVTLFLFLFIQNLVSNPDPDKPCFHHISFTALSPDGVYELCVVSSHQVFIFSNLQLQLLNEGSYIEQQLTTGNNSSYSLCNLLRVNMANISSCTDYIYSSGCANFTLQLYFFQCDMQGVGGFLIFILAEVILSVKAITGL